MDETERHEYTSKGNNCDRNNCILSDFRSTVKGKNLLSLTANSFFEANSFL